MSERFVDVLLDHLCDLERYVRTVFAISITILLLLLVSLFAVEYDRATFVVIVIDLISLVVVAIVSLLVLVLCRRKRNKRRS